MDIQNNILLNDKICARIVCMSPSWMRAERRKRKHGLPHTLNIDPVMIGTSPRYRIEDVEASIAGLTPANGNSVSEKGGA